MASRISEQIIEWLTVGGNAFSSQTNVPLLINKVGISTATIPTTNGSFIAEYINQGQLWVLGAVAASANVKSSQIIVSSSDNDEGGDASIELWRGTNASWQINNTGGLLTFKNNYTTAAQTTYSKTAMTLYYNAGQTVTYNSRSITPVARVHEVFYADGAIETSSNFVHNTATNNTANGYYLKSNNVDYARLYINAFGTANSGSGNSTSGAVGAVTLSLGNNIIKPAAGTAGGANNARGIIELYGTNAYRASLMSEDQVANVSFYIPKLETTGYAIPAYDLSGSQDLNTKYDAGIYSIEGGSVSNYPTGSTAYANLLVIPYRKPSKNSKPDYAIQIYGHSLNRLWFRGSTDSAYRDWREVAHIAANTAVGSTTKGVYVTAAGVVTAMTYSVSANVNAGTTNHIAYYSGTNAISSATNATVSSSSIQISVSTATALGYNLENDKYNISFHLAAGGNRGIYEHTNTRWLLYFPNGSNELVLPGNTLYFSSSGGKYIRALDKESHKATLIGYNGSNLWIGAEQSAIDNSQIYGNVYIHAGLNNTTDKYINQTIYMRAGADATDTEGTTYAIAHGTGGSATKGIYTDSVGRVHAMTYSISSTVSAGKANAIAYYSGANTISASTRTWLHPSNRYPLDLTLNTDAGTRVAEFWYDAGNATNVTGGTWAFRAWSPNSTANTTTTGFYENYYLPGVTVGRSANATYYILTTKATVTVAQGGTGATTAAGARANLATPAMTTESYPALLPTNGSNNWIKIGTTNTDYGLLPSQSGSIGAGHNYLGTSSWYWKYGYIDEMYGHHLTLQGATSNTMSASSGNPRITFQEGTSSQPVHLVYTDYDSYRGPAGLKVVGGESASPAWFEVEGDVYGRYLFGDLSVTRTNEIRFHKNGLTSNISLYFGYKWADGSTSPLITKYIFENCNTQLTDIQFHTAQTSNYGTGAPGSSTHQNGAGSLYFQYIN